MSTMKTCRDCGVEKPESDYYTRKKATGVFLWAQCKDCAKAQHKEYAEATKERKAERSKQWASDNKDRMAAATGRWRERNREKSRAIASYYVAVDRLVDPRQMPSWADASSMRQTYHKAKEAGLTVDHIVPIKSKYVCGLHCEANIQIISEEENREKRASWWPDCPGFLVETKEGGRLTVVRLQEFCKDRGIHMGNMKRQSLYGGFSKGFRLVEYGGANV